MGEWISVNDMLPEPWLYVLVAMRINGETRLEIGHLSDRCNWIVGFGIITGYVTHWMPLVPPKYEE